LQPVNPGFCRPSTARAAVQQPASHASFPFPQRRLQQRSPPFRVRRVDQRSGAVLDQGLDAPDFSVARWESGGAVGFGRWDRDRQPASKAATCRFNLSSSRSARKDRIR